ncbi:MAG: M3 family metallopeptidase [Prevotellaceae bacterium]|jgi:peptidyl-dipeptidase Dcp|nr:M3 family metallopeptidase [Prevotellaceae bacterium]
MTATINTLANNPFFQPFNTPHQTAPFDKIKIEHYQPAFEEGIKLQQSEIDAIVNNPQIPDFQNTIVALEYSGEMLGTVGGVFFNLLHAETTPPLDELSEKISPVLTEHRNNIVLNAALFERVKAVYAQKETLGLNTEDNMLLQKTYDMFAENGANLSDSDKEIYRELTKELSGLTLKFSQNVLNETNKFELLITDKTQLSGLPGDVLETAAQRAKEKGKEGWLFDLKAPSFVPFMKYADNRDLRREMYLASNRRAFNNNEFDNQANVKRIANLRLKIANLFGYQTYADYVLRKRMAENQQNVYQLLDDLRLAYKPVAEKEVAEVQQYANTLGADFELMPWDWSYFSEKLKEEKYSINDELLKPYFELEQVKKAVFDLTTRLYGLQYKKTTDIPVYHPEVETYEVFDENGKFLAVLYTDFYPRDGKSGGAWMTDFRGQKIVNGENIRPLVSIVMNFTRPTETKPALLTFDELTTFLHEFGHALHGMLANSTYEMLSGTNVYRDFVELPSQIMENWATEKAYLDSFAKHYETGATIPQELMEKIKQTENFNIGYLCVRQLSFGYLDMAWHTLITEFSGDIAAFEREAWANTQVLPLADNVCMSVQFNHIFSGGYAAGYYSYKWAEVLDADAFSLFAKNGIFDKMTAESFKNNILTKGGSEHPMTLYKRFRGQAPSIDALLKRNGILSESEFTRFKD